MSRFIDFMQNAWVIGIVGGIISGIIVYYITIYVLARKKKSDHKRDITYANNAVLDILRSYIVNSGLPSKDKGGVMAKKKYYAVRNGKKTGIFYSWEDCRKQVAGYSGAEYKSFGTEKEAKAYLGVQEEESDILVKLASWETSAEIYVDGSYYAETGEFSYGMVVLQGGQEYQFSQKIKDPELAQMHNVAGEIKGAEAAMQYALDHQLEGIIIYHDYEGIAKWCTGEWKANKPGTRAYRDFYQAAKESVDIRFVKVKGHSNNEYNDLADQLAKRALGLRKGVAR